MENLQLIRTNGQKQTSAQPDSSIDRVVRERITRLSEVIRKDGAPYPLTATLVSLWVDVFVRAAVSPEQANSAFDKAERTVKGFWPAPGEVLALVSKAEENATEQAAEKAWQHVLDIRRTKWSADVFGGFYGAKPQLSERIWQACRASGVFRDFDSLEALHVWAKKKFVESFIAYGELEQDQYLLPDGEIKNLLTGFAETKALPESRETYQEMRERGLRYAQELKSDPAQQPDLKRTIRAVAGELAPRPPMRSLDAQKQILRERGFLP